MIHVHRAGGTRVALAVVVAAALAAACGGSASPSPSSAPSEAVSNAPSVAPSVAPSESAAAPSGSLPSIAIPSLNADADLEKQLPDQLGGETLVKLSIRGSDFLGGASAGTDTKQFTDLLGALGKSPSDVSVAVASATQSGVGIIAFRIAGTDASQILSVFLNVTSANTAGTTVSDASLGGKSVKKLSAPSQSTAYAYAHGDVLFFMEATAPQAILDEAFSKLP